MTVPVPAPGGPTERVEIFRDKIDVVPAEGDAVHAWCSAFLGADVRLVHLDDPATRRPVDPGFALPGETVSLADGYPLLLTTTASLDALNTLIAGGDHADEGPLPMNRFRPNLVVEGTTAWAEDTWSHITVGEVAFRVAKPSGRCVVTTTDQRTAERGREPLRSLGRHRRFGDQRCSGRTWCPSHPVRSGSAIRSRSSPDGRDGRDGDDGCGAGPPAGRTPAAMPSRPGGSRTPPRPADTVSVLPRPRPITRACAGTALPGLPVVLSESR